MIVDRQTHTDRQTDTLTTILRAPYRSHRRRLPSGNGGDCPRRKTLHRAPPCKELDPATLAINDTGGNVVRYQACLCAQSYILFLGNQQKLRPPEPHILTPICTISFVGWGFAQIPLGELTVLPHTSSCI